ncbi:MAG: hypothetical protein IT164_16405 [Bryobacterales bacterium]|nr:hypothetical protein [Bryobacterales bacterium]
MTATTACAQYTRSKALAAVVARGDRELAAGREEQARAAWSAVLAFEPSHQDARKKLDALKPASFSLAAAETGIILDALRQTSASDWCGFPAPTPDTDLVNVRMLADQRLLPSLRATSWGAQSGPCAGTGAFGFLAAPLLTITEVRQAYGKPQAERKDSDGSETLTYDRFRVLGAKDGKTVLVIFPPFNR